MKSRNTGCMSLAFLLATGLAACSNNPTSSAVDMEQALADLELQRDIEVETIRYANMDDWTYLDKYHIVVKTRKNVHFLISFKSSCYGLSENTPIIIESTTGTLSKFDDIMIDHRIMGIEYCAIDDIVKLIGSQNNLLETE